MPPTTSRVAITPVIHKKLFDDSCRSVGKLSNFTFKNRLKPQVTGN
jgi:hypothetical protein